MELQPGEKAAMSLTLPKRLVIAFDPVTHASLSSRSRATGPANAAACRWCSPTRTLISARPSSSPDRRALRSKTNRVSGPCPVWVHSPELDALSNRRRPVLTANRLLSNQTFRDLYQSGTFDPEQRFKITSLTILFTDLRGSTALYDRVGDLAAFDLVRDHFGELLAAVAAGGGAVVNKIGDAVMATFPTPDRALRAAMRMREAMGRINEKRGSEDLALNIGLHEGPCLAVMLDDRQDYFGLSVNIVGTSGYRTSSRQLSLRGVSEAFTIYEIRERQPAAAAA